MKKLLVAGVISVAALLAGTGAALAQGPTPGGGAAFGEHIAAHAPDHPRAGGAQFGQCVSMMALHETCPDHAH